MTVLPTHVNQDAEKTSLYDPVSGTDDVAFQAGIVTLDTTTGVSYAPAFIQETAGISGGSIPFHYLSLATTNAKNVKNVPGQLYGYTLSNTNASAPVIGTDIPKQTIQVPGNMTVIRVFPVGLNFAAGISFGTTTGIADTDTGAVGLNDLAVDMDYK